MTAHVLTGSKQEIAQQVANFDGEVREAVVFVEDTIAGQVQAVPGTADELFKEMEPYMTGISQFDDSRDAIYSREGK